jgi:hypothetical protein
MDKQPTPSMRLARTRARQNCTPQIRTRQLAVEQQAAYRSQATRRPTPTGRTVTNHTPYAWQRKRESTHRGAREAAPRGIRRRERDRPGPGGTRGLSEFGEL